MKTPSVNSRILKLEVLKGTATRTSVNAVESRTTSLESDVATLTQGTASAVSTHNTAPDAHADIRTLVAGKQDSLTISDVGEAMLALATPSGQKIPRVNADGSVVLINVPSGDGVGGSSWYASDDGPTSVDFSLSWVSNGDANGVFRALGSESGTWANPASSGRIRSLASSIYEGTAESLTDRATTTTTTNNVANSWFAFDLGVGTTLALDSYSLQGRGKDSNHQLRTWVIQGSNDVTDWTSVGISAATWTTIDSRTGDPTISNAGVWGHWAASVRSAPYRFIRIMQTGANSYGAYYLALSEVELYGLVSASVAKPAGATGWARNSELIDDATAWMPYYATSALTDGTPIFGTAYDVASAVSTHNTAPDSHADLRTLIGDRALSVHQHARTDLPWISDPGAALLTAESASAQRTALGMTAWAVAPWTDGTTSDIPEGTQLYFTNARADARADARIAAQKGQAEGIMPLGSSGKAPLAYMPDALIGQVKFKGVWDAATNSPVLPSATTSMGHYYVTSVAGSYGGIDYGVGDWCISDGTAWGKVDNSDAITSFAGRVGAILPIASDYSSFYLGLHAQADDAARLGGQLPSYYAQAGHVHNYAGSSTPGGDASRALVLAPLSGYANYRLAYTADGACIHREAYGRVVMSSSENGETYGVRVGQADMVSDPNFHRITNPGGATFVSQSAQQIGAIAVHLPVGMTNTMVRVVGRVFEFATSSSFDFVICGYAYEVGNTWGNYPTAYITGDPRADRRFTVRFGYDSASGKAMLYLGELSTAWSFPQVFITEVQLGYSGMSEQWTYGWNISFESTAFSNVTATISDCQVGYRTPNAFTGAKVIGGTTYNFVNGLLVS